MPRKPRTESHSAPTTVTPIASHSWILEATKKVEAAASALYESLRKEERSPSGTGVDYAVDLEELVGNCFLALVPLRELIRPNEYGNFDRIPHPAYKKLAEQLFEFTTTIKSIYTQIQLYAKQKLPRAQLSREHLCFTRDVSPEHIRCTCKEVEGAIIDEAVKLFTDFPETKPEAVREASKIAACISNAHDRQAAQVERERKEADQAELLARFVAAMKRLRKNTTQKPKLKASNEGKGLAGNAFLIVTELTHHHRIIERDATLINRKPHSVAGIAKNIAKGKSVVSDFFAKHFREPDGTKGHAVYAKWCRDQWDAVVPTLLGLVESANRELSTGDVETKRKPDRLIREHRNQTAKLDAELDKA